MLASLFSMGMLARVNFSAYRNAPIKTIELFNVARSIEGYSALLNALRASGVEVYSRCESSVYC